MVFHSTGSVLFLLYINYLHFAIKSSETYHFADDTHLLNFPVSTQNKYASHACQVCTAKGGYKLHNDIFWLILVHSRPLLFIVVYYGQLWLYLALPLKLIYVSYVRKYMIRLLLKSCKMLIELFLSFFINYHKKHWLISIMPFFRLIYVMFITFLHCRKLKWDSSLLVNLKVLQIQFLLTFNF